MRISFAAALLLAVCPLTAGAQDKPAEGQSPAPPAWTKERIESPPKRAIRFEQVPELRKHQLTRPDPKLLELKFIASLKLAVPTRWQRGASGDFRSGYLALLPLSRWERLFSSSRINTQPMPLPERKLSTLGESFQKAIAGMPATERPQQEIADYFTDEQVEVRFRPGEPYSGQVESTADGRGMFESERYVPIEFLATSSEQAEKVAAGFLNILDWGVCRPVQLDLASQREANATGLTSAKSELSDAENGAILDVAAAGRRSFIWSGEIGNSLSAQKVQLLVERVGIRARMDASEKLMARTGLAPERRGALEDERLKAEVDLASVEARLAAIAATFKVASAESKVRGYEQTALSLEQQLGRFAPPVLVEGVVVIRPLEWQ